MSSQSSENKAFNCSAILQTGEYASVVFDPMGHFNFMHVIFPTADGSLEQTHKNDYVRASSSILDDGTRSVTPLLYHADARVMVTPAYNVDQTFESYRFYTLNDQNQFDFACEGNMEMDPDGNRIQPLPRGWSINMRKPDSNHQTTMRDPVCSIKNPQGEDMLMVFLDNHDTLHVNTPGEHLMLSTDGTIYKISETLNVHETHSPGQAPDIVYLNSPKP